MFIGGATTSSIHTAVRISPEYDQPVVYFQDASRVVGVVSSLLNPRAREEFAERNRKDQERRRRDYLERQQNRRMLTLQRREKTKPRLIGTIPASETFIRRIRVYGKSLEKPEGEAFLWGIPACLLGKLGPFMTGLLFSRPGNCVDGIPPSWRIPVLEKKPAAFREAETMLETGPTRNGLFPRQFGVFFQGLQ
ncbi:MAG: hypothetical protein Ct9H90mP9_1840 [Pseudomonadota bacterium]|nr:MAG: hypothetical protein Ct9H90mP9_1840 [Pseudomonadota bacterium]